MERTGNMGGGGGMCEHDIASQEFIFTNIVTSN